ncbi:hypothetical protein GOODEAATRI_017078 [Goodea atripinnis]|uniref:Uncharacterized protein n=1 Tax=Goodea atripinnis TaxID=208336 RepID=A0ABV0PP94_9TELE
MIIRIEHVQIKLCLEGFTLDEKLWRQAALLAAWGLLQTPTFVERLLGLTMVILTSLQELITSPIKADPNTAQRRNYSPPAGPWRPPNLWFLLSVGLQRVSLNSDLFSSCVIAAA